MVWFDPSTDVRVDAHAPRTCRSAFERTNLFREPVSGKEAYLQVAARFGAESCRTEGGCCGSEAMLRVQSAKPTAASKRRPSGYVECPIARTPVAADAWIMLSFPSTFRGGFVRSAFVLMALCLAATATAADPRASGASAISRDERAADAASKTVALEQQVPQFAPWMDGTTATEPEIQVQPIDADTFVLRQSVKTNFEAPFLYLLFGNERALLIDSGAGGLKIRPTIDALIDDWSAKHGNRPIRLIVAHSHGHGDHHAGDDEFRGRPATDVVGLAQNDVAAFFHIADWPRDIGRYDLGGRAVDIVPTPGHEAAHIMVYDARTRLLFSGDMLYPGRLYVPLDKFDEFRASTDRLAAFTAKHPVRALLGAHIEMTREPGLDYPMKAAAHPSEHPLPLAPTTIAELQEAAANAGKAPTIDRHTHFIVYPVPPRTTP